MSRDSKGPVLSMTNVWPASHDFGIGAAVPMPSACAALFVLSPTSDDTNVLQVLNAEGVACDETGVAAACGRDKMWLKPPPTESTECDDKNASTCAPPSDEPERANGAGVGAVNTLVGTLASAIPNALCAHNDLLKDGKVPAELILDMELWIGVFGADGTFAASAGFGFKWLLEASSSCSSTLAIIISTRWTLRSPREYEIV